MWRKPSPETAQENAMKITEVLTHPLSAKLQQKSWTAHESSDSAQLILFEVRTDEGITGYGEVQGGPQKLICDMAKLLGDVAVGMDAVRSISPTVSEILMGILPKRRWSNPTS
jgi:L-alanine-DL-glutamate epimerase-like enolase superfamily enzyme